MLAFYSNKNGRIHKIPQPVEGCWVNAIAPDDEDIEFLERKLGILPEHIQSSLDEEESSRIESEDGQTLIIIDVPVSEKEDDNMIYSTMPIGVILNERNVVTISIRDNTVIHEMANGLIRGADPADKNTFVLQMMLRMSARYLQYLKQIDKITHNIERELRRSTKNKELTQLLDLEKSLVYFQTSLKSDEGTLEKMMRGRFIKLDEDETDMLDDILVEIKQAIEMANIYSGILSGTMDAFASVISNNLNIVMKVLTSVTLLLSIPTMIFSLYGMNIGSQAGGLLGAGNIWIPLGIAAGLTAICFVWLYKKDMF